MSSVGQFQRQASWLVFFVAFSLLCVGRSGPFVALFLANHGGFFNKVSLSFLP